MSFAFDKLPPPPPRIYVSKDALNHFLSIPVEKNGLRSAKNVVFSLFWMLVHRPNGGEGATASLPVYATEKQ